MPKEEWGTKRLCPKCNIRFYDLNNDPMTCPSCEAVFELAQILETNKKTSKESEQVKPAEVAPVNPITENDDMDDGTIILDDSESDIELTDDLLDEDDDDSAVSLEEIADVPADDEDN